MSITRVLYLICLCILGNLSFAQISNIPKKNAPPQQIIKPKEEKNNNQTNRSISPTPETINNKTSDTIKPTVRTNIPVKPGRDSIGKPNIHNTNKTASIPTKEKNTSSASITIQRPSVELAFYEYRLELPIENFEILSKAKDLSGKNPLMYIWKTVPFRNSNVSLVYNTNNPKVAISINHPGEYKIRHVVLMKDGWRDSVDFRIFATSKAIDYAPVARIKIESPGYSIPIDKLPILIRSTAVDPESKSLSYKWTLSPEVINCIDNPLANSIYLRNLNEGRYTLKLEVSDITGKSNIESIDLNITPASSIAILNVNPSKSAKSSSQEETNKPIIESIEKAEKIPRLKGGPTNFLIDLVAPGIGHYFVSGDYSGYGRKKIHFATTITVGSLLLSSAYFKYDSERLYNNYVDRTLEYQLNEIGLQTGGVRGRLAAEVDGIYTKAKRRDLYFKGLAIAAGAITIGDTVWTLLKGLKNSKEYNWRKRRGWNKVGIKLNSNSVGIRYSIGE